MLPKILKSYFSDLVLFLILVLFIMWELWAEFVTTNDNEALKSICRLLGLRVNNPTLGVQYAICLHHISRSSLLCIQRVFNLKYKPFAFRALNSLNIEQPFSVDSENHATSQQQFTHKITPFASTSFADWPWASLSVPKTFIPLFQASGRPSAQSPSGRPLHSGSPPDPQLSNVLWAPGISVSELETHPSYHRKRRRGRWASNAASRVAENRQWLGQVRVLFFIRLCCHWH